MFHVFLLLIVCSCLACGYSYFTIEETTTSTLKNEQVITKRKTTTLGSIAFFALCVTMILFAGLRTESNDTLVYASGFEKASSSIYELDWKLGSNPLFLVYEAIIKRFISKKYQQL